MNKYAVKLKIDLHQPKKWEKHKWVTEKDIQDYEAAIYNDLDITDLIKGDIPEVDYSFLDRIMVEDEIYAPLEGLIDDYYITTFGRIISTKRMKTIKPSIYTNSIAVLVRQELVNFKKEFIRLGWIYSPSLIKEKYKKYNWPVYQLNKKK